MNATKKWINELKEQRGKLIMAQSKQYRANGSIIDPERFTQLAEEIRDTEAKIDNAKASRMETSGGTRDKRFAKIEGRAGEAVPVGGMEIWRKRAVENKVLPNQGSDRDWNRAFGEMAGFATPSIESRSLLEDTTGSASSLSINQYLPQVIDVLLPQTILGKLGIHMVPMDRELVQMPIFTSTYAGPQWIAEGGNLSLDAGPAFSNLQLQAPGGWKFYTAVSLEAMQDAYLSGTLQGWLAQAAANKLRIALDTSFFMGVQANVGVPGIINESGFVTRQQTSDGGSSGYAPTDTQELAVLAELAIKKYIDVNQLQFVSNVGVHEAFERIPLATYGRYFQDPPLISGMGQWVTSENSALSYTETDTTTPAQTGGSYSSLYCGPFSTYCYMGVRMDLGQSAMRLDQRLIDQGLIGLFSMFRGSMRTAHPETFTRTVGVITK